MGNLWLKIRVWTKVTIVAVIALYILLFIFNNTSEVKFWWWIGHEHTSSVFVLSVVAFLAGGIFALLARTTWTTIRQIGELRSRTRMIKLEKNLADQQRKASKLQTRSSVAPVGTSSSGTTPLTPGEEDIP
jgi:uncharacterized integral membrane protein